MGTEPVWHMLLVSGGMALAIAGGKIVISILSAYAVVFFRFPFRRTAFWLIFITLMLPVEVRIIPTYAVMSDFGLINSFTGLTVPLIASATATLLFRQVFVAIPDELVEAARMDGAGPLRFLRDILIPVSAANIAALFVILFVYGWNQYLWPLLVATDPGPRHDRDRHRQDDRRGDADRLERGDGDRRAGAAAAGRRGGADAALVRRGTDRGGEVTRGAGRVPLASGVRSRLNPRPFRGARSMVQAIGVDFGTTNSVVALLHDDGSVTTQRHADAATCSAPSSASGPRKHAARRVLRHAAGPAAIAAYLEDPLDSRLIMSMKTYLAQKSFTETRIFGHPFTLERLIGCFLRDAPGRHCRRPPAVIVGRPVRFAGEFADDALGADRLRGAYAEAGLAGGDAGAGAGGRRHPLRPHPDRSGHRADRRLRRRHQRLLGHALRSAQRGVTPLGHAGIGIAGDVFDYRIIDRADRAAARQGRHLPRDGQAAAGAARVLLRVRALAPAVADAHAAHAARHRRGGAHRAASRAPAAT